MLAGACAEGGAPEKHGMVQQCAACIVNLSLAHLRQPTCKAFWVILRWLASWLGLVLLGSSLAPLLAKSCSHTTEVQFRAPQASHSTGALTGLHVVLPQPVEGTAQIEASMQPQYLCRGVGLGDVVQVETRTSIQ